MAQTGRINISSGAPWEDIVGYSRAVRIGNTIEIAGTTAMINDTMVGIDDVYLQCCCIFDKMKDALQDAGAGLENIVRTRAFITDISRWEEYAKAHSEYFDEIRPVTTLVEVNALINAEMLIEIEATAIISGE